MDQKASENSPRTVPKSVNSRLTLIRARFAQKGHPSLTPKPTRPAGLARAAAGLPASELRLTQAPPPPGKYKGAIGPTPNGTLTMRYAVEWIERVPERRVKPLGAGSCVVKEEATLTKVAQKMKQVEKLPIVTGWDYIVAPPVIAARQP